LTEDESLQCRLRWQNERAMFAAELAVMYSSSAASGSIDAGSGGIGEDEEMEADPSAAAAAAAGSAGATKSRDSTGSRKRKQMGGGGGGDDSDADTAAQGSGGSGGMAAAAGYVEVCGLELPQRQQLGGGGGGGAAPLVHTPAVDRNLEALALGAAASRGTGVVAAGLPSGRSPLCSPLLQLHSWPVLSSFARLNPNPCLLPAVHRCCCRPVPGQSHPAGRPPWQRQVGSD
jgi:hypothetical protein